MSHGGQLRASRHAVDVEQLVQQAMIHPSRRQHERALAMDARLSLARRSWRGPHETALISRTRAVVQAQIQKHGDVSDDVAAAVDELVVPVRPHSSRLACDYRQRATRMRNTEAQAISNHLGASATERGKTANRKLSSSPGRHAHGT